MDTQKKTKDETINMLHDTEARWFAVYTRYKREKMVCKRLQKRGVEVYLPLQQLTRYYTRKVKKVELPLLSCYIFVKISKSEYVPVLEDQDVVKFVKQRRDLLAIPEREINILRMVCGEGIEVEVREGSRPVQGDKVEIISGRLTGLQGILQEDRDRNFVLQLDMLGYELLMEVPVDAVRILGS